MNYNGNKARPAASQNRSISISPQPWHPDYNRTGKNPLDLPEQKKRMERIDDDSDGDGIQEKDDDDDDNRRRGYPESGKARNKPRFFSRMRDRLRTKVPPEYKVSGTGRLAQFSNERLYLHWIRFGILQGGVAVLLLSYGIGIAEYIGVGALVLALLTLIYSTTLYHLRHLFMVTKRKDAIYFERWIPTLLTLGLIALYLANFLLTLKFGDDAISPPPWTSYDSPFGL
ncbi:vacuolar transporter chaperone [Podila minutissima]|nr:vacuolar transporter chaperone [Podila minutissima]